MMPRSTFLLASVAALALSTAGAMAADYDPPIFIEEAPEYVPVEIGSGWYLRGDIGYNFDSRFKSYDIGTIPGLTVSEDNTSLFGGIGVGYNVNDILRTELNFGFVSRDEFYASYVSPFDPTLVGSGELDSQLWTGMLHAYADLGTIAGFTPYIGGGVGLAYARSEARGEISSAGTPIIQGEFEQDHFSFAYALGAGINYQLTPNASIDVGYQYLNAPDAEFVSITEPWIVGKGMEFHQVKVGLRYALW